MQMAFISKQEFTASGSGVASGIRVRGSSQKGEMGYHSLSTGGAGLLHFSLMKRKMCKVRIVLPA